MLKKNKWKILLSSIIILLPALFGVLMWNTLPASMTTHWGADGNADGFSSKAFAVFGLPLILLVEHFLCLLVTALDKKQSEQSPKALNMIFWIMPLVSVFANGIVYRAALGYEMDSSFFVPAFLGVMFIFMGNYLPKVKQNSSLGIKLSWTLHNEENWNKTHRFGGKVWVIGGIVMLLSALLPLNAAIWVTVFVIAAIAILPAIYSYRIYKTHQKEGVLYITPPKSKAMKISAVIVAIVLIGIAITMFTGDIEVSFGDTSFAISATYWTDIEVTYSEIDSVAYREDLNVGIRTNGFGSARLAMGIFQNGEFGTYTLYAYTGAKEYIVLTSGDKTLVIGFKDAADTKEVYDMLCKKIDG